MKGTTTIRTTTTLRSTSTTANGPAATSSAPKLTSGQFKGLGYHVVKPGDSLKGLAKRYGVSEDQIRRANGIINSQVTTGARLLMDPPIGAKRYPGVGAASIVGGTTSSGTVGTSTTYVVRPGDTLSQIAVKYRLTLSQLMKANSIKSVTSVIRVGQKLTIPGTAPKSSSTTTGSTSSNANSRLDLFASGSMVCPVAGSIFSHDWGFPRSGGRFHEGLDMFAKKGTPILAPVAGTVSFSESSLGGLSFTLDGDDTWRWWGTHLSKYGPKEGRVKAGEIIGYVGDSGNAKGTWPHLHLQMKPLGGRSVSPFPYMVIACRR